VGIFFIFEAWKCDFAQSWNPRFKVPSFRGAIFPQVPIFVWPNYPHCLHENVFSALRLASLGFAWIRFPWLGLGSFGFALASLSFAWLGLSSLCFISLGLASLSIACLGLASLELAWFGLASLGLAWFGWWIDGNLRAWKCHFAEFRNSRCSGHLTFNSFFSILKARKFDFCRDYLASCEQILRILASSQSEEIFFIFHS